MDTKNLRDTLGQICALAALAFAIAAALKMFGMISIRAPVLELAAVAIALAHVR